MPKVSRSVSSRLREIPSIDDILRSKAAADLEQAVGRDRTANIVRNVVDEVKKGLERNNSDETRGTLQREIEERLSRELTESRQSGMQRVINATGVIIHTNLGRAPLSAEAVSAAIDAAAYCNLEFDLASGTRGRRGESAERLLAEITEAEDALIVNNCAAAALLVLSAFGRSGEVIISRGELVEIGGDFRIPDVLERSGAILREVGTTNRTKLADYERAIGENTKFILRVHPSNFRITGFTETPAIGDLADLAHKHDLLLFEDAGSGALVDLSNYGLDEPVIAESIKAGVDIVSFSGDKLMGGSQAGIVVGRKALIETVRKDPLYRALRPDKMTYAIIEATLRSYALATAFEDIPVLRNLSMMLEAIEERTTTLIKSVRAKVDSRLSLSIISGDSAVGGGAAPNVQLATRLIVVEHVEFSANEISERFRSFDPPIIGRVADDHFLIDLRTVTPEDESLIADALQNLTN